MDGEAVQKIITLCKLSHQVDTDGETFVRDEDGMWQQLKGVQEFPPTIEATTLDAIRTIVVDNPQDDELDGSVLTVDKDFNVYLLGLPGESNRRPCILKVSAPKCQFEFGAWYPITSFNIALLTQFAQDAPAQTLFNLLKTVKNDTNITVSDTGLSAKVSVQKGVSAASTEEEALPKSVLLSPYRIYPECEQPASPFLLRIESDDVNGVKASLSECDGGKWRLEAYKNIVAKIHEVVGEHCPKIIY